MDVSVFNCDTVLFQFYLSRSNKDGVVKQSVSLSFLQITSLTYTFSESPVRPLCSLRSYLTLDTPDPPCPLVSESDFSYQLQV